MACIFEVKPFDGGWCVKICDTGEVLFFSTAAKPSDKRAGSRRHTEVRPGCGFTIGRAGLLAMPLRTTAPCRSSP
jgi:hypothetical protein